jgi:hypothetical protein
MKPIFLSLVLLVALGVNAQTRKGLYGSLSVGYAHYDTYWYYYRYNAAPYHDNYDHHSTSRYIISLGLEQKDLFSAGPLQFDVGGDLLIGPYSTLQDVSKGGYTVGLQGAFTAAWPLAGESITPHIGIGPHIAMLHMKAGDGAPYADPWNEFIFIGALTAGVDFKAGGFIVTPAFHVGLGGASTSTWQPNEDGVDMNGGPGMIGVSLTLAKRF